MKKIIYSLVLIYSVGLSSTVQGQSCGISGVSTPSGAPACFLTPSTINVVGTQTPFNTTINVVQGLTYNFNTCATGPSYDSQISLWNGASNIGGNDDFCGLLSDFTWVATYTGVLTVQINEFFCSSAVVARTTTLNITVSGVNPTISSIVAGTCNNNGTTPSPVDDYYLANITVNLPVAMTGNVELSGSALAAVPAPQPATSPSVTFSGVRILVSGGTVNANVGGVCIALPVSAPSIASCSAVSAATPTLGEWGLIIFSILIIGFASLGIVLKKRQLSIAGSGISENHFTMDIKSVILDSIKNDMQNVIKNTLVLSVLLFLVFFVSITVFQYELTRADVPSSIIVSFILSMFYSAIKRQS